MIACAVTRNAHQSDPGPKQEKNNPHEALELNHDSDSTLAAGRPPGPDHHSLAHRCLPLENSKGRELPGPFALRSRLLPSLTGCRRLGGKSLLEAHHDFFPVGND